MDERLKREIFYKNERTKTIVGEQSVRKQNIEIKTRKRYRKNKETKEKKRRKQRKSVGKEKNQGANEKEIKKEKKEKWQRK